MADGPLRILLLSGSCARVSHTLANVRHMERLLEEREAVADVWDILAKPIPVHNPEYHRDPHTSNELVVRELAERADAADGFVWATPVYHNSFSGILKNCLDNLTTAQFRDKPVALMSHGGARSGVQPCDQLRIVVKGLLAVAIPSQIVTIGEDFVLDGEAYRLSDPTLQRRFLRTADELIKYVAALRTLRGKM
jgi:azobenzene reductase